MIFVKTGSMVVTSYLWVQPKYISVRNFYISLPIYTFDRSCFLEYSQLLIVSLVKIGLVKRKRF